MGGEGAGPPARLVRDAGARPPVRLALMRHAKSSWRWDLPDRHRPLAKRGKRSARAVARRLEELGWAPDLIVASPALRSAETWVEMTELAAVRDAGIVFEDSFYGSHVFEASAAASIRAYLGGIRDGQRPANVLCLGHNPGWSLAVEAFTGKIVHLKTADVALLEGQSPEWPAALGATFSLVDVVRSRPLLAQ